MSSQIRRGTYFLYAILERGLLCLRSIGTAITIHQPLGVEVFDTQNPRQSHQVDERVHHCIAVAGGVYAKLPSGRAHLSLRRCS